MLTIVVGLRSVGSDDGDVEL